MVKLLVWPVVLYGCQIHLVTLLQDEINRLKALEAWLWRRLEKISCRDKIHTDEVFVNGGRCLIKAIRQRQKDCTGHVLKGDGLFRDVMKRRMTGKKRADKSIKVMIIEI